MVSHNFVISSNVINQARFSINRISANPAVTSGLSPRDYGINLANTNPLAAGLPSIVVQGFFGGGKAALGDAQQPFVDRVNHVWQVADDLTWITGRHALKSGLDVRREAMRIAFINRPNGDLTFSGGLSATRRPISCSARRRRRAPRRSRRSRTATAGCLPATRRTSSASPRN